jgi:hypothetical protein
MKSSLPALALLVFLALATQCAPATSCIQNKPFKVKQVCGVVVAPDGTPMPHVLIELMDFNTDLPGKAQGVETDKEGRFALPDAPGGEYAVSVRLPGLATASQNFVVSEPRDQRRCKERIVIQMQVAGRCSTISLARKH